jgi:pyridoxal 5'-phosphate synthase pdxT subunit
MKVGVLAVQGAVSEHLSHLRRCGIDAVAVKEKTALDKVSGLIIPGGESTTIGKLLDTFGLANSIRERCCDGSLAVFGTCAGMVLMAEEVTDGLPGQPHLGLMKIKVKRNAFGRQRESFETELQFNSFEPALTAVFIRAPKIEEAAAGVEVLARLEEDIVAAKQGLMLTTSFHPELTDDLRVHRYFIEICKSI